MLPFDFDIFAPSRVIIPWAKRLANGSWTSSVAEVGQRLGEEARVHQVQDRVLDAADVLVDRQPVVGGGAVPGGLVVARVEVADEVPGGVDEGVHRVGLAAGRAAAARALGRDPVLGRRQRALALRRVVLDLGQLDRQLVVGDRDDRRHLLAAGSQ